MLHVNRLADDLHEIPSLIIIFEKATTFVKVVCCKLLVAPK